MFYNQLSTFLHFFFNKKLPSLKNWILFFSFLYNATYFVTYLYAESEPFYPNACPLNAQPTSSCQVHPQDVASHKEIQEKAEDPLCESLKKTVPTDHQPSQTTETIPAPPPTVQKTLHPAKAASKPKKPTHTPKSGKKTPLKKPHPPMCNQKTLSFCHYCLEKNQQPLENQSSSAFIKFWKNIEKFVQDTIKFWSNPPLALTLNGGMGWCTSIHSVTHQYSAAGRNDSDQRSLGSNGVMFKLYAEPRLWMQHYFFLINAGIHIHGITARSREKLVFFTDHVYSSKLGHSFHILGGLGFFLSSDLRAYGVCGVTFGRWTRSSDNRTVINQKRKQTVFQNGFTLNLGIEGELKQKNRLLWGIECSYVRYPQIKLDNSRTVALIRDKTSQITFALSIKKMIGKNPHATDHLF